MAAATVAQPRLSPAATEAAIAALKQILGDRVTTAQAVREQHGRDESWNPPFPPDAVVFPHSTEEVSEIVKICASHGLPIIPYGAGTSLEGHVSALQGGVCIDMMQMNNILKVNAEDLDVVCQPGVTRKQLNEYLRDTGLFFPIDPGANASIGGMVSTRASGTNAVRYGTMRENVLALTVVLADGRIIRTSKRAKKSAAGYDLTRLFVGSEGTLGVITEITLRLYGIPEAMSSAICSFATLEGAVNTVIQTIQSGIPVARIELLDDVQVDAINKYSKTNMPVQNLLMLEFHGTEAAVAEQAEMVQAIAADQGGNNFQWTVKPEERAKLWQARHDAAYAAKALRTGCEVWATDVCVPISRLAECILETKKDVVETGLTAPLVGHVGDGNFHLAIVLDRNNPAEIEAIEAFSERLVHRALSMDGTCTGEHGIGRGKMKYLVAEHGEAVSVMLAIKKALDPNNLMNPGKIFSI
ncbi:FAD-linked oxidase C-terminal domain-containing protein [uncultured Ferrovibrio sp.]|uniref:FAD-binding oxidoreductase n=1 Tax=uncultured Ferrovibrio sp. TaxID=1576913 RepID=UPI00261C0B53|nr:FAD-linked oxidase C-terminal domain-containing protein [uncultured Ferrovibrio sp.]